jgi:anti-sigma factor RsiW
MVMGHDEINRRLDAYMDGEVGAEERETIERHLSVCAICAAALSELRRVSGLFVNMKAAVMDEGMMRRLHEAVEMASVRRRVEWLAGALTAMAACVAVVVGLNLMRQSNNQVAVAPSAAIAPAETVALDGVAMHLTGSTTEDAAKADAANMPMAQWAVADISPEGGTRE